ncbi:MAG TPA: hypothetical protein VNE39_01000 [Planctomycetota bacterium]|nr:hypothetical protein [Planctomycetota bacterium]
MSKGKESGAGAELPMAEGLVWVCLAVAALATVYVLMKEPEDGAPQLWDQPMVRFRVAALAASAVAGLVGLGRVVWRGGGQGLFGMAVLFNVILACFWALRFLLVP